MGENAEKDLPLQRSMCYKIRKMFGRRLTAPEALRYYADKRTRVLRETADCLDSARRYTLAYRQFYARLAVSMAQKIITLLEFMLSHLNELPTDEATIEVLRNDLADMKRLVEEAELYIANPFASPPK